MNKHGLSSHHVECLQNKVKKYLRHGEMVLYGSRAKGTHKPYSDADLVIKAAVPYLPTLLEVICSEIADSDFPYLCDLQLFEEIRNYQLIDHIQRVGISLFKVKPTKELL